MPNPEVVLADWRESSIGEGLTIIRDTDGNVRVKVGTPSSYNYLLEGSRDSSGNFIGVIDTKTNQTINLIGGGEEIAVSSSRNAAITDIGKVLACNSVSAINITVQQESAVQFSPGTVLTVYQVGAGASTFLAGSGVTFQGSAPAPSQYQHIGLRYRGSNIWAWV